MYSVRGRSAATAATAGHAVFQVWNPHTTQTIKLVQLAIFKTGAGTAADSIRFQRSTARGVAGSTVTPDIDNHSIRGIAPPSGFLLDLAAFTTQPTLDASELVLGWTAAALAASGIIYPIPGGVEIPPGTGIVCTQVAATAWPASEITVVVLEDW